MIITLTGENDFGRLGELKKLVDAFVAENGELALERIDGDDSEITQISETLTSLPFLASKKMVVFKNPGASKDFAEKSENLLKNLPETTDLIIVEPKFDKRTALYKYLKKASDFREFNPLAAPELATWLTKEAAARGGKLSPSDARYLVERAGESQQKLSNELDKLIQLKPEITHESIEKLVAPTPRSRIFDLLDAAFAGDKKRTLRLYNEQRQQKVEPQQIVAMLAWQLHILALVKVADSKPARQIAADAKINPFVVEKSANLARKLELTQIKRYISQLLDLDERSKSVNLDVDSALKNYLLSL